MENNVDSIELRMYRIGTGDCFTLKFLKEGVPSFKMMIDCGSCKGNSERFTSFVELINKDFNNELDLLIITHEHLDHIIGFSRALAEFEKMTIKQVWVAWTEDPTNTLSKNLKEKYGKNVESLKKAIQRMNGFLSDDDYANKFAGEYERVAITDAKLNFLNGLNESLALYQDNLSLAPAGLSEMGRAMNYILKTLTDKTGQSPFYCRPGAPVPLMPGTEGIRFYVLGPPENELALKTEEVKDDVYQRKTNFHDNLGFNLALEGTTEDDCLPFPNAFAMTANENLLAYQALFEKEDNRYRNIDCDWLNFAGSLAIRLEKYINNTSLVLAIEFIESGKVLLFPGDAQSGNWESWHDPKLKWDIIKDGTQVTVTAKDLLKRTVFYKVGHHLSHNGTASKSGLDLMESQDLMSVATLDYHNINTIWKKTMPSPGVLTTLINKTKGRVFRIDEALVSTPDAIAERNKLSTMEQDAFQACHKITDDFIQLTFKA